MAEYLIPKSAVIFEEEIKKSRFITYLQHTEGLEQAKAFWAEIKAQHPNACLLYTSIGIKNDRTFSTTSFGR